MEAVEQEGGRRSGRSRCRCVGRGRGVPVPVVRQAGVLMEQGRLAFTAVYLKSNHGYVGFIEELPAVNSYGRTLDEAREPLQKLAAIVFDEERSHADGLLAGKSGLRDT